MPEASTNDNARIFRFPSQYFSKSGTTAKPSVVKLSNKVMRDLKDKYSNIDDPSELLLSLAMIFLTKLGSPSSDEILFQIFNSPVDDGAGSAEDSSNGTKETKSEPWILRISQIIEEIDTSNLSKILEKAYASLKIMKSTLSFGKASSDEYRTYTISFQNGEKLEVNFVSDTNEGELKFIQTQTNCDADIFLQDLFKFIIFSTCTDGLNQPISFEMKRIENLLQKYKPLKNMKFVHTKDEQFTVKLEITLGNQELIAKTFQRQWEHAFDVMYSLSTPENLYFGWTSSITGEAIALDQMKTWTRNTVGCILDNCHPSVVLEAGCGSGLMLLPIAPKCKTYVGTDISTKSLETLGTTLASDPAVYSHVTLRQCEAIAVSEEEQSNTYDTIICNSVLLYFRDSAYLEETLENFISICKPGGKIFLGDLLNLANLEHLYTAIQLHKLKPNATRAEFVATVRNSVFLENELNIHPTFFQLFAEEHQDLISGFDVLLHRGIHQNELMDFRYNVILHKKEENTNINTTTKHPKYVEFKVGQTKMDLENIIKSEESILIQNIPNARTHQYSHALSYLPPKDDPYLESLKTHMQELKLQGIHPEQLALLAEDFGHSVVRIMPSKIDPGNKFDIFCTKDSNCEYKYSDNLVPGAVAGKVYADFLSDPVRGKNRRNAERALKQFLLTNKSPHDISRFHIFDDHESFVNSTID